MILKHMVKLTRLSWGRNDSVRRALSTCVAARLSTLSYGGMFLNRKIKLQSDDSLGSLGFAGTQSAIGEARRFYNHMLIIRPRSKSPTGWLKPSWSGWI